MKKILFIVTSANKMGDNPTGIWYEELSTPYYILTDGGCEIMIASPKGGAVKFDPASLLPENMTASVMRFQRDILAQNKIKNTKTLSALKFKKFDAIFIPGGHGAVVDLPHDETVIAQLGQFFDSGNPVGAICHGLGAFVNVKRTDGNYLVHGKKFTCFSDAEENAIEMAGAVPFLLESRLKDQGGIFESAENFKSFIVRDGNLVTGQNPASSEECAEALLHEVKAITAKIKKAKSKIKNLSPGKTGKPIGKLINKIKPRKRK